MSDYRAVQRTLELRAAQLSDAAGILPVGDERDGLLHRATKMEAASLIIDRWLSPRGARAPR
jgi:hypothetical protein